MESLLTPGHLARIMESGERPDTMTVQVEQFDHVLDVLFSIFARFWIGLELDQMAIK